MGGADFPERPFVLYRVVSAAGAIVRTSMDPASQVLRVHRQVRQKRGVRGEEWMERATILPPAQAHLAFFLNDQAHSYFINHSQLLTQHSTKWSSSSSGQQLPSSQAIWWCIAS